MKEEETPILEKAVEQRTTTKERERDEKLLDKMGFVQIDESKWETVTIDTDEGECTAGIDFSLIGSDGILGEAYVETISGVRRTGTDAFNFVPLLRDFRKHRDSIEDDVKEIDMEKTQANITGLKQVQPRHVRLSIALLEKGLLEFTAKDIITVLRDIGKSGKSPTVHELIYCGIAEKVRDSKILRNLGGLATYGFVPELIIYKEDDDVVEETSNVSDTTIPDSVKEQAEHILIMVESDKMEDLQEAAETKDNVAEDVPNVTGMDEIESMMAEDMADYDLKIQMMDDEKLQIKKALESQMVAIDARKVQLRTEKRGAENTYNKILRN